MIDRPFSDYARSPVGALTRAASVTPDDAALLPFETRAMILSSGGDVCAEFADGQVCTLVGLRAGVLYPFALIKVKADGTTATGVTVLA